MTRKTWMVQIPYPTLQYYTKVATPGERKSPPSILKQPDTTVVAKPKMIDTKTLDESFILYYRNLIRIPPF